MYRSLKKILFRYDPEQVHHFVMKAMNTFYNIAPLRGLLRRLYSPANRAELARELWGLQFPNPVGLAAGFDKNATYVDALSTLGFGFVEIGTVTPRPQPGNPQPRLFRLPADEALINRMGFNNDGVQRAVENIKKRRETRLIIGGNIGKNKDTPLEAANNDYEQCFLALHDVVDYFVVNVSSPNTPGLRQLQDREPLTRLLGSLRQLNEQQARQKPILLKIAPDLTNEQLDDIVAIVQDAGIQGIIATNTTIARDGLKASPAELEAIGAGGLSGRPLHQRSVEVVKRFKKCYKEFIRDFCKSFPEYSNRA
ncbi:MAG: quinone-dependent dihydroorotate dehydrogenase, partial [Chitinophagia bacterium]|nr:quinone-dependent dihydroorotate dehydrogenase [Chitinophagia bacterium]